MKNKLKTMLTGILLPAALLFAAGCSGDATPYEKNNDDGYTVSVKYDSNGGIFDTNSSVIMDSFNISEMKKNADGTVDIALLDPNDAKRGANNRFSPTNANHFLAGYYSNRTESLDENGNTVYSYSNLWDFDNDLLKVDSSKKYSADEPVMTLYAVWIPYYKVDFYNIENKELIGSMSFSPLEKEELLLPIWDPQSGAIKMNDFPKKEGYTFDSAFLDEKGENRIEAETIPHSGKINYENGTAENSSMKIYVSLLEGEIFHIYTAAQFVSNYKPNGTYIIHEDLDFADTIWPSSLTTGSFEGKIVGNGHIFKNINVTQNDNAKPRFGIFGQIGEKAVISDLSFESTTVTIKKGIRTQGSSYSFFAGLISEGSNISGVSFKECTLAIDSSVYFFTDDYSIGLVCGMGNTDISAEGISCEVVGDNPERLEISVVDGEVNVDIKE